MQLDNLKARRADLQKAFEEVKARAYRIEGALVEVNAMIADLEAEAAVQNRENTDPPTRKGNA